MPKPGTSRGDAPSGPEVLVPLDRSAATPLRAQLEEGLRDAVADGRLPAGGGLPSSRAMARDLGVSRRLVVEAYAQLTAEGMLVARPGAGTRVADVQGPGARVAPAPAAPDRSAVGGRHDRRYDLFPGHPDLGAFPRTAWLAALRDVLREVPDRRLGYPDPTGAPELRAALAGYLARARGVVATPERVVVVSGAAQGLALVARALARAGRPELVVEDPSLPAHRELLAHAGARLRPVAVDAEGVRVAELPPGGTCLLTPAHQMPTGVALSQERRTALARWARAGGLVIEDDYDAEFRYDRAPLAAVQRLAPDRTAYLGSASKSLSPGLRLGWLVLPDALLEAVRTGKAHDDMGTDVLSQLTLARMLERGTYDRHLRALRRRHRERRDAVVAALRRHLPGARPLGVAAGLHLTLELPHPVDPAALEAACADREVGVYGVRERAIVLGYASLTPSDLDEAVRRLTAALASPGVRR
jgi:GntR family transcriptional regulator/MocR family aminotransferase